MRREALRIDAPIPARHGCVWKRRRRAHIRKWCKYHRTLPIWATSGRFVGRRGVLRADIYGARILYAYTRRCKYVEHPRIRPSALAEEECASTIAAASWGRWHVHPSNTSRLWVASADIGVPSLARGIVSGWDIVEFFFLVPGGRTCWRRTRDSVPPMGDRSPPDFTSILVSRPGGAGRVREPSWAFCWSLYGVAYGATVNGSRN